MTFHTKDRKDIQACSCESRTQKENPLCIFISLWKTTCPEILIQVPLFVFPAFGILQKCLHHTNPNVLKMPRRDAGTGLRRVHVLNWTHSELISIFLFFIQRVAQVPSEEGFASMVLNITAVVFNLWPADWMQPVRVTYHQQAH